MTIPLEGLRVLDLSAGIAGPYATKLLADAGADVVKIEPPGGDPLRRWKASAILGRSPPLAEGEDGALFRFLNTSKRSLVLDLERPGDGDRLLGLLPGADLIIESFAPGRMRELGLGIERLQAIEPRLSLVSITPWGQEGPWALRAATGFTLQAETGSTAFRGYADRLPVGVGGRLGEYTGGAYAAVGALSAVLMARASGRGQHVDVSIFEAMLLAFQQYWYLQKVLDPGTRVTRGVEVPSIEPARDGWVGFCTITGQQWKDFTLLIERPDLERDPELVYGQHRFEQIDRVLEAIHAWTRRHDVAEVVERASLLRIPVTPVGNGCTVLSMDHFVERRVFVRNPAGFLQPRVPYRLGRGENRPFTAAPRLGEHGEEILGGSARASPGRRPTGKEAGAAPPQEDGPPLPLAGVRVVDFSAFWAGPIVGSYLAALGADVIKIESIQRPDGMRLVSGVRPTREALWERSAVFHGANTGKRGITLNLESQRGLALARELVEQADIVIENFSPRVIERFGLGWEQVHDLNPEAILVRMPAYGLDGPWRDRTGFAMNIEQVSGLAWVTGFPDRSPLVPRGVCDPFGGMTATFATLLALEVRADGGGGQLLEVPLVEAGLNAAAEQVAEWSAYSVLLERGANRGPVAAPQGVHACAGEGMLALAVENDEQWAALVRVMGSPAWAGDPSFSREEGRRASHDTIDQGITRWLAGQAAEEAVEKLAAAGVPAGTLRDVQDLRAHPQLEARGFFATLEHPVAGALDYPRFPMRFSGHPLPVPRPAPTLGQHNREVLQEQLGLPAQEIEELRREKLIGERPTFMNGHGA